MYDRPPTGTLTAADDAVPSAASATGADVAPVPWQLLLPEYSVNVTLPVGVPWPPDTVTVSCTEDPIGAETTVPPSAFLISVTVCDATLVAGSCSQVPSEVL